MRDPVTAPRPRPALWTILTPKWRGLLVGLRQERTGSRTKFLLLAVIGVSFWSAVFGVFYRFLSYVRQVEDIGDLLAAKVLGIILLAFLSILILSNIITALSTFFLAKDLDFLVAAPVGWIRFYAAKLGETILHSSWMFGLLAVPILTAYGIVYHGGPLFPFVCIAALAPFLALPAVGGTAVTVALVNVFPARRTRELLGLIAIGGVGLLVLLLRLIRPERLARPEGFRNFVDYLAVLRTPTSPYLPSEWATSMIMNWLLEIADPIPIAMLWIAAVGALAFGAAVHRQLFYPGFSKAQEGSERKIVRSLRGPVSAALGWLPPAKRELILKDLRLFFRDNTQWSQLILLAVLLMVYLFNIKSLPIHTGERLPFALVTMISFLNLGLAGFVLAAVAARFVFPGISLEGRQMWLLRSSPLEPVALLWSKYWIGTVPLLVLALAITLLTNSLLQVSAFMMAVSLGTIVLYTLAVSALAVSFGVFYPQFGTENAAQIPTSYGGVVYMMASLTLLAVIIMIEAVPVASSLRSWQEGVDTPPLADLVLAGLAVIVICASATIVPLRLSSRRLERMEW